jgi:ribosomal protein S27E
MSLAISGGIDWTPQILPCAPRPINGELLSSWMRRLAAANAITLTEMCACLGDLLGGREKAVMFDYGAPKVWRLTVASMARVPERWVWALDLQQQFPAIGREWFLHDPAQPQQVAAAFCPECFHEQIAARQRLHLKAEWTVALVTRCFRHQLPLCRYCPWCGHDQPVHFQGNAAVQCLYCEHTLTIRRWLRSPDLPRARDRGV